MVWILDNGEGYSDHVMLFVEGPEGFRMQDYLKAVQERFYQHNRQYALVPAPRDAQANYRAPTFEEYWSERAWWRVIATASAFIWYEDDPLPLEQLQDHIDREGTWHELPRVNWKEFLP